MIEEHPTYVNPTIQEALCEVHFRLPDGVAAIQRQKNEAALRLLEEWLADDSGYDEQVWDTVKSAIETNRLSYRRRFDD